MPSAALALVVAWACAGGVLWQAARIVHYHVVRSGVESERLTDTVLLTTTSKAVWIEEDELRYEGRMFDVRERTPAGEDWILIGHYDHADDEIFELLHALFGLGSRPGDGPRRCAVFLPEATIVRLFQHQLLLVTFPKPMLCHASVEDWASVPQGTLEHPPENRAFEYS